MYNIVIFSTWMVVKKTRAKSFVFSYICVRNITFYTDIMIKKLTLTEEKKRNPTFLIKFSV